MYGRNTKAATQKTNKNSPNAEPTFGKHTDEMGAFYNLDQSEEKLVCGSPPGFRLPGPKPDP